MTMTDNAPLALEGDVVSRADVPTGVLELSVPVSLPGRTEYQQMSTWANVVANGGLLKTQFNGRPDAVMTVMLIGRELGLPPMEALRSIYIIENTPTLAAHLQRAIIKRAGHRFKMVETTNERATFEAARLLGRNPVTGEREYDEPITLTYTIEQARQGKLLEKDTWKKDPTSMLRARCSSQLARLEFPDVLMGCVYTADEVEDQQRRPAPKPAEPVDATPKDAPAGVDPATGVIEDAVLVEDLTPPTREELWWELQEHARVLGKNLAAHTSRWAAAHRKNVEEATDEELFELVTGRRDQIARHLEQHPEVEPVQAYVPVATEVTPEPVPDGAEPAEAPAPDLEPVAPQEERTPEGLLPPEAMKTELGDEPPTDVEARRANRIPYVDVDDPTDAAAMADACRRSAAIDRSEAEALGAHHARYDALIDSAMVWDADAQQHEESIEVDGQLGLLPED